MKDNIYSILKAKFLISDDAFKTWKFIVFLLMLSMIMIWNSHQFDKKTFLISDLTIEVKSLRAQFVDTRSALMQMQMESNITKEMEQQGIFPADVPPQKIIIQKEKSFIENIWP